MEEHTFPVEGCANGRRIECKRQTRPVTRHRLPRPPTRACVQENTDTFARDDKQPPAIEPSEDNIENEAGMESIAVWTGVVWLIMMKEANNTPGDMTIEVGTKEQGGANTR